MEEKTILELKNISKSFPGVQALNNVSIKFENGKVHAIVGENGAGKSTLIKILSGVYQKDNGVILINGKEIDIQNPRKATELGISTIYQELNLLPNLSIAENIFVGREKRNGVFYDKKTTEIEARKLLLEVGMTIDVGTLVKNLSIAQRQLLEVAKALSIDSQIIIMDEPTSSLAADEIEILLKIVKELRHKGKAIIYISHKLDEIYEVSDKITVLRDGESIGTVETNNCSEENLIQMMVGRPLVDLYPKLEVDIGDEILRVDNVTSGNLVKNVSFTLRKGEILGVAGLVGSGRSELMSAVFGIDPIDHGSVIIDGIELKSNYPKDSIDKGIGFVPEDRKMQGLILKMSIRENITISCLEDISSRGFISSKAENAISHDFSDKLQIKSTGIEQKVENLSGGNQQKVVIAKWLATRPKILILDEPTRGIDVGAKKEIYTLIGELVKIGVGIILVSSELPEVLGMSDRIMVMHEGLVKGFLSRNEATQEKIMSLILK
ncbi:MAG: sugar ABC transporter ATP-binding protein [Clostridiaceae bacterium]|nr:sugar ABC transporter ATP-binding protein [Clostridiaceae bacterium]